MNDVITIHRHILAEEKGYPGATGEFSMLLSQIAYAAKEIQARVSRSGLLKIEGSAGKVNVQGEEVQHLDIIANDWMKTTFAHSGLVAGLATEEEPQHIELSHAQKGAKYLLVFDPLDGSSNIDANVSTGTIFSILSRTRSPDQEVGLPEMLQPGLRQIAAGYILYGSSMMMVYSSGSGVHGFTYNPTVGEFILSHPRIQIPDRCKVYSANALNRPSWPEATRRFVRHIESRQDPRYQKTTFRYIGSLVADFHRNLLYGGVFLYPQDQNNENGKLRLLYEANPLAFIARQAGGDATDGSRRILEITPDTLHQRVPLIIGNLPEIELYEEYVRKYS